MLTRTRVWHVIDARGHKVGRLANHINTVLQGKHKPIYNSNMDCGDYVVVYNVEKMILSGKKWDNKLYRWHTGYPGGLKDLKAKEMLEKQPDDVLRRAVNGMLPKNKTRKQRMKRLKLYVGEEHPHQDKVPLSAKTYEWPEPYFVPSDLFAFPPTEEEKKLKPKAKEDPEAALAEYGGMRISLEQRGKDWYLKGRACEGRNPPYYDAKGKWKEKWQPKKRPSVKRLEKRERIANLLRNIQEREGKEKEKQEPIDL